MSGHEVLGSDDDIATTTKMIEIGLVRIVDQPGDSSLAVFVRAVQGHDRRSSTVEFQGNPQVRMRSLAGLHAITDQFPPVDTIDDDFLVDSQIQRRFLGLVLIPQQFEVTAFQHRASLPPIAFRFDSLRQIIPRRANLGDLEQPGLSAILRLHRSRQNQQDQGDVGIPHGVFLNSKSTGSRVFQQ